MQVRKASEEDADKACQVIDRSFTALCHSDHHDDARTISLWRANRTAEKMRRWIDEHHVFVAVEDGSIVGVGGITASGEIILSYVSPDARFRGISKALVARLEATASDLAVETITLQSSATAHQFYISRGYKDDGPSTKGYGRTFCYPMAKRLICAAPSD